MTNFIRGAMIGFGMITAATAFTGSAMARTLTIQTSFNAGDFSTKYLTETWLPQIDTMTDGRINITLTPNGSVVPAKETIDAVSAGVIDGDFTSVNYFAGVEPAFALLGDLISGYETPIQMIGFCKDGPGEAIHQKVLDSVTGGEVHLIGCGPYSRESLPARVPIRTFEDLKGKKIRAPEGLASAVFAAAGASPVSLPFSEVYGALEKGIVDAADSSAYVNNAATGLHDVAPYPIYPGIHSMPAMQFTINQQTWDEISPEDQQTLRRWWYAAMEALATETEKQDQALVAQDAKGDKVHVISWSDADRAKLRDVAQEQWLIFAKKSPLAQEVLDADLSYMKQIGLISK